MSVKHVVAGAGVGGTVVAIAMQFVVPLLNRLEGVKHVPYYDVVHVLTVCAGHTGPDVVVRKVYTAQECDELTEEDVTKAASGVLAVSPNLKNHPMQLASAISFSYNIGVRGYARSSVAREFNAGNYSAGCKALFKYEYAKGRKIAGLVNRRKQEYAICMKGLSHVENTAGPSH